MPVTFFAVPVAVFPAGDALAQSEMLGGALHNKALTETLSLLLDHPLQSSPLLSPREAENAIAAGVAVPDPERNAQVGCSSNITASKVQGKNFPCAYLQFLN